MSVSDVPQPMPHVLVVEDEEHLAVGIKYNLEAEGYRVTAVGDGTVALSLVEGSHRDIDLVILDLMLPGMSGYEVCQTLRASGHNMPILILSARTLSEDRTRGFDVGADQYMMKPFDLSEFLSRVKNLLAAPSRRSERGSNPISEIKAFEFGNAKINFETFEVIVSGQAERMTKLELKLLHYFIAHEGRVIPRAELLENVWETSPDSKTRAPDQFIRRLRKTLEPNPQHPRHFITIRDVGYRFLAVGDDKE